MTTTMTSRTAGALNPTRQQLDELDALLQRMLELPVQPLHKPEQAELEEPDPEPPSAIRYPPSAIGQTEKADSGKRMAESGKEASTFRVSLPPVSYTVVETASPRPLPAASGFEPKPSMLAPRLVPVSPPETPPTPAPVAETSEEETWVPLRSTWQPSPSTWPPLAESWHQANSGTPSPAALAPIVESRPEPTPPLPAEPELPIEIPLSLPANETPLRTQDSERGTESEPSLSLPAEDAPVRVAWPLLPLVWFNQGFDACMAPLGAPGGWLCGRGRIVLGLLGLACLAGAVAIAVNSGMAWSW